MYNTKIIKDNYYYKFYLTKSKDSKEENICSYKNNL